MKQKKSYPNVISSVIVFLIIVVLLFSFYLYQAYVFKQKTVQSFTSDIKKITEYTKWGYDTHVFEQLYDNLVHDLKATSFVLFPFKKDYFQKKHDNILLLVQAGYATDITKQKELIQSQLSYLRDRVKTNDILSPVKKQKYSDAFEIIAGTIFEENSDLVGIKKALTSLDTTDKEITKEVESTKKEALLNELQTYRASCQELLNYFTEKKNESGQAIADGCVSAADKLMGQGYVKNGAEFLAALSRERVFTALQKANQAKQDLIQAEQYALSAKQKEEERLTLVPPAPRQEGKLIVVNLSLQRLYAYENGKTVFSLAVPITTGKQGFETVTGEFAIYLKEQQHKMVSPFPGIYYDDVVNYWMPFYLGYGLHDAPWRSIYGTQDYPVVGSHGCVNMPLKDTIVLYNWAEVGTRVIVL